MGAQLLLIFIKTIFKLIPLVSKLIRWPASVVLRQSIPNAALTLWRIYGEWAYECSSPWIRNDRKWSPDIRICS